MFNNLLTTKSKHNLALQLNGKQDVHNNCPFLPFVVSKVEIDFSAVVENVDFSVFVGRKSSGVDVDVGIDLDGGHLDVARLQDHAHRAGDNALANAADDATSDKDVLHD